MKSFKNLLTIVALFAIAAIDAKQMGETATTYRPSDKLSDINRELPELPQLPALPEKGYLQINPILSALIEATANEVYATSAHKVKNLTRSVQITRLTNLVKQQITKQIQDGWLIAGRNMQELELLLQRSHQAIKDALEIHM